MGHPAEGRVCKVNTEKGILVLWEKLTVGLKEELFCLDELNKYGKSTEGLNSERHQHNLVYLVDFNCIPKTVNLFILG